jgi:O-antigen ligase
VALLFLLSLAERGRWLMLQDKTPLRFIVNIAAGILLLLSTSRGSWLAVTCSLVVLLIGQRDRGRLLKYVAMVALVLTIWFNFADPATLDKYIFKTFHSSAYWSAETNARVAQWTSFPRAFADSPVWGFGPGSGKAVSIQYSGHSLIWHALYLHIAIECGSIGIGLLAWFLLTIVVRSIKYAIMTGELVPLLGIVSFMVVGGTIPAIDGASGLFLGCGLLSFETSRLFVRRTAQRPQPRVVLSVEPSSGRYLGSPG